jgi:hypothetical protein
MQQGFSRRGWLLGLFAGLAGLAGLRRRATATPAAPRPAGNALAYHAQGPWVWHPGADPLSSVTTYTYDPEASLAVAAPLGQVTTYTYVGAPREASA